MEQKSFTRYEVFVVAILTILQFTLILAFMVLSPLGALLMPTLNITTSQFGMVVSAYAFSAGLSGILAAVGLIWFVNDYAMTKPNRVAPSVTPVA